MAWLSGPFAFCSVTELLPWPESGVAAARARRAHLAARAGSLPARPRSRPGPARLHVQVHPIGVHITAGREGTASGQQAGSSGFRAGEGGCQGAHPAPATGGALGSWARDPWDKRFGLERPSRLGAPQVWEGRGGTRAGAFGFSPPGARGACPTRRP